MSRMILTLTVTPVALDLTNKSALIPTQMFVKSVLTQKSTTSIHKQILHQNMVGDNCNLVNTYVVWEIGPTSV